MEKKSKLCKVSAIILALSCAVYFALSLYAYYGLKAEISVIGLVFSVIFAFFCFISLWFENKLLIKCLIASEFAVSMAQIYFMYNVESPFVKSSAMLIMPLMLVAVGLTYFSYLSLGREGDREESERPRYNVPFDPPTRKPKKTDIPTPTDSIPPEGRKRPLDLSDVTPFEDTEPITLKEVLATMPSYLREPMNEQEENEERRLADLAMSQIELERQCLQNSRDMAAIKRTDKIVGWILLVPNALTFAILTVLMLLDAFRIGYFGFAIMVEQFVGKTTSNVKLFHVDTRLVFMAFIALALIFLGIGLRAKWFSFGLVCFSGFQFFFGVINLFLGKIELIYVAEIIYGVIAAVLSYLQFRTFAEDERLRQYPGYPDFVVAMLGANFVSRHTSKDYREVKKATVAKNQNMDDIPMSEILRAAETGVIPTHWGADNDTRGKDKAVKKSNIGDISMKQILRAAETGVIPLHWRQNNDEDTQEKVNVEIPTESAPSKKVYRSDADSDFARDTEGDIAVLPDLTELEEGRGDSIYGSFGSSEYGIDDVALPTSTEPEQRTDDDTKKPRYGIDEIALPDASDMARRLK